MTGCISLKFVYYAQKSFLSSFQKSFKYVAEALTPLLRLGTLSRIVARDSHKKFQLPTLVAEHQAEVRGPPVGRGPQVETRCTSASSSHSSSSISSRSPSKSPPPNHHSHHHNILILIILILVLILVVIIITNCCVLYNRNNRSWKGLVGCRPPVRHGNVEPDSFLLTTTDGPSP